MFKVQLANNRPILDWRLRPGRMGEKLLIGVVIVELPDEEHDNYVTWEIASRTDGLFDAFNGHYFQDLKTAANDFRERARML